MQHSGTAQLLQMQAKSTGDCRRLVEIPTYAAERAELSVRRVTCAEESHKTTHFDRERESEISIADELL